ncbi:CPXCG motif-containing cysteine-rich protein [Poseidonibacter antarcticus]|uniref:CPXCG motif-containing cysteine-rich protein n=1 Tax=Poseidonibacter antarcticus TaxID=2478538 RepID=UPI000EF471C8|nr:CPXCG motif-containing cysteine-rich protein [Poseidonibacter antarcticus]
MEEMNIQCPYCLQAITILLDTGVYEYTTLIDDCEVCCRPIEISYNVEDGVVSSISYTSMDGNEY